MLVAGAEVGTVEGFDRIIRCKIHCTCAVGPNQMLDITVMSWLRELCQRGTGNCSFCSTKRSRYWGYQGVLEALRDADGRRAWYEGASPHRRAGADPLGSRYAKQYKEGGVADSGYHG